MRNMPQQGSLPSHQQSFRLRASHAIVAKAASHAIRRAVRQPTHRGHILTHGCADPHTIFHTRRGTDEIRSSSRVCQVRQYVPPLVRNVVFYLHRDVYRLMNLKFSSIVRIFGYSTILRIRRPAPRHAVRPTHT